MSRRRFRPSLPALLVALAVAGLGVHLGAWQLERAQEKRLWLARAEERGAEVRSLDWVLSRNDPNHYGVRLSGHFDNDHTVLLDNRMRDGVAGYHVLSPFRANGHWVLVNRGWIPRGPDRDLLPAVAPIPGDVALEGQVYVPSSRTFTLEATGDTANRSWPLRVQKVEMGVISALLGVELAPFEIRVAPDAELEPGPELPREWRQGIAGPERHLAYALQWFLLSAAALAVFVAASFRKESRGQPDE